MTPPRTRPRVRCPAPSRRRPPRAPTCSCRTHPGRARRSAASGASSGAGSFPCSASGDFRTDRRPGRPRSGPGEVGPVTLVHERGLGPRRTHWDRHRDGDAVVAVLARARGPRLPAAGRAVPRHHARPRPRRGVPPGRGRAGDPLRAGARGSSRRRRSPRLHHRRPHRLPPGGVLHPRAHGRQAAVGRGARGVRPRVRTGQARAAPRRDPPRRPGARHRRRAGDRRHRRRHDATGRGTGRGGRRVRGAAGGGRAGRPGRVGPQAGRGARLLLRPPMGTVDRVLPWRRHHEAATPAELTPLLTAYRGAHRKAPVAMISRAYEVASEAHRTQLRSSGESYINHPLAVARIVADIGLDEISVAAALLHDAVEDTEITLDDVRTGFGDEVASIVDGVTKLERIQFDSREAQQAATMRKMLVAMARDLRVLIIKLADRLHNMRTLAGMPMDKQRRIAQETLDIYAPLAHRLGMQELRQQLEDLSFAALYPKRFAELDHLVMTRSPGRDLYLAKALAEVRGRLAELNINAD